MIELNDEFRHALKLLENTNEHVLITGRAGTGKSTLLEYFRNHTKKKVVVLAPTGVAALNVRGQTIHSFFNFKADVTPDSIRKIVDEEPNVYSALDSIVIDEISMVRADLLDCVDRFLRLNCGKDKPFAGKQMIFFGDLYQLPPVVTTSESRIFSEYYSTGYFFSAKVMDEIDLKIVELEKVYRQHDPEFIEILDAIRHGEVKEEHLEKLNKRFIPDFEPSEGEFYVYLTSRNDRARKINMEHLENLKGKLHVLEGEISGNLDEKDCPTDRILLLKKGAQVMMVNNDAFGRWVNGSVGQVVDIHQEDEIILVEMLNGEIVEVTPHEWNLFRYRYDPKKRKITTERLGSFRQYPIRLAWAITIHRSQGKTFDRVVLDISGGLFAPGQLYVALSRCKSMNGLILKQKIKKEHVMIDWKAAEYITSYYYRKSNEKMTLEEKEAMLRKAIEEDRMVEIVYLKPNGRKSRRVIKPLEVEVYEYKNRKFLGVKAICLKRQDKRVFRLDRILELKEL